MTREILDLEALIRHGMIDRRDVTLLSFADDPAAALRAMFPAGPEPCAPAFARSRIPG